MFHVMLITNIKPEPYPPQINQDFSVQLVTRNFLKYFPLFPVLCSTSRENSINIRSYGFYIIVNQTTNQQRWKHNLCS